MTAFLARFARNRGALVGAVLILLVAIVALLAPVFYPTDPLRIVGAPELWPGDDPDLPLGTDSLGRDLLARLLIGLRVSLAVGVTATAVSLVIGVAWGATAGYVGGKLDELMMRFVDLMYSVPLTFFVIILMVFFGRNFILMFLAIGAVEWLTMARIVRGQTLSLKAKEFIEAARAAGVPSGSIIARHIVPNLLGPVVIYVTLTIPAVILAESFLSFLGLGVQEPLTSLGVLISNGAAEMELAPWLLVFPSVVMVVTLVCFNFIGDGLRDAIDPKDR